MALNYFTPIPATLVPMANVTPVTYRDGTNLMRELEHLKERINETLIPEINISLTHTWDEMTGALFDWNERWDTFMAEIQAELAARNDAAIGDLIADEQSDTHAAFVLLIETVAITAAELTTALAAYATDAELSTGLGLKIDANTKGAANGVASLDGAGKVPAGQLPTPAPSNLAGSYGERPAANTVAAGTVYYGTDVQETYRSTGSAWTIVGTGGNELGYASTAGVPVTSTTSTTGVNVPGLAVSFTAGSRPVEIMVEGQLANGTAGYSSYALILLDGVVKRILPQFSPDVDVWNIITGTARAGGLVPGQTYVASVQIKTDAPGTARFGSDASLTVVNR